MRKRADLAIEPLHRRALHDPVAAVELHRAVHHPLGHLGGLQLGHGSLAGDPLLARVLEPGRLPHEQARALELDVHLRERHLGGLELGEGPAELPAALDQRTASSKARWARPQAAAPTLGRKVSRVARASL